MGADVLLPEGTVTVLAPDLVGVDRRERASRRRCRDDDRACGPDTASPLL